MSTTTLARPTCNGNGGKKFKKQRWGRTQPLQMMQWGHDLLGSIEIGVANFKMSPITAQVGPNNWTRIYPMDGVRQPKVVQVRFTGQLNDGVALLYAQGTNVTNMMGEDKFPAFNVPVAWKARTDGDDVPHTRVKDMDNIDLILILDDKIFQLQVSVITRKEKFWLCAQETHGGQVIKTTVERAAELGLTPHQVGDDFYIVAPLFSENAYPGADYLKNFKDVGGAAVEHVVNFGKVVETEYEPEQWTMASEGAALPEGCKAENGWKIGMITWFNVVLGWGFALDQDGNTVFVHFQSVVDEDKRPIVLGEHPGILQPMSPVAFKTKKGDQGLQATMTCIL
ncbi:cold shock domain-containing protein [Patescibacteria group bacterium]|nr:cold shock domain-containing protein [Patescibacteria group bacterium]